MNARDVIKFVEDGLATLTDLRQHAATEREAVLSARLAADLRDIAEAGDTGEGSEFWQTTCRALVTLATEDDPLFFMRWDPIRATMVHGASPEVIASWWRLRRSPDWHGLWARALRHRQYGHPPPFPLMPSTNAMTIEHATHLFRFRQATGLALHETDRIVEFGGGYGSMCRLIHALGFKGEYVIFDLPHILALQRYYLGLHGIDTAAATRSVHLLSDIGAVERLPPPYHSSTVSIISTWALSEMPISLRERIEPIIEQTCCRKMLLSYQAAFEGNDNRKYFRSFADRTSAAVEWTHCPIGAGTGPESPFDSHYMFGVRR